MSGMTALVTWQDVVLRLAAALLAGGLIGFDRTQRARIAGLRTTILICLAATGAMIEANMLLDVGGKTGSSFAVMDTLRFPLGILSGIGFIGAGAILRRGNLVTGVTTAATLWLTTVIGLLLGAGYFLVGGLMTLLAFGVLKFLKGVEPRVSREHRGHLIVTLTPEGPSAELLCEKVLAAGYTISSLALEENGVRKCELHLEWDSPRAQDHVPPLIRELRGLDGVLSLSWTPISAGHLFE
jgi:putative Mg2+ transporter-C (MgtC) family protein